ncbi:hypothetical protein SPFM20_00170 [Salmonella phage SPFM20]|nr:hypothetical protein SPFM20_00170 [Salmonella phage SPFM20]
MKADIPPLWDLCMARLLYFHVVFVLGIGFEHKAHELVATTMWSCHGHGPYSKKNTPGEGWVEKGVRDACEVICSYPGDGVDLDVLGRFKLRTSKALVNNTTIK